MDYDTSSNHKDSEDEGISFRPEDTSIGSSSPQPTHQSSCLAASQNALAVAGPSMRPATCSNCHAPSVVLASQAESVASSSALPSSHALFDTALHTVQENEADSEAIIEVENVELSEEMKHTHKCKSSCLQCYSCILIYSSRPAIFSLISIRVTLSVDHCLLCQEQL